jgi:endonuclease YncB( thermonuclease family)
VLILALLFGLTCHAGTIDGRVVGVADGDTVTMDADKVPSRCISGIDAPEKVTLANSKRKPKRFELFSRR